MVWCHYHRFKRCWRGGHCDIFQCESGNVLCCVLNSRPNGRFAPRLPSAQKRYIFSKHNR
jgi:hypothetical protein